MPRLLLISKLHLYYINDARYQKERPVLLETNTVDFLGLGYRTDSLSDALLAITFALHGYHFQVPEPKTHTYQERIHIDRAYLVAPSECNYDAINRYP